MKLESAPKGLRRLALYEEEIDDLSTIRTPRMKGRFSKISMTQPEDISILYEVRNTGTNPWRMDGFGKQSSREQFEAKLFSPIVLNAFTVRRIRDNEIIGMTVLYKPSFEHGWCYVEVMLRWKHSGDDWKILTVPTLSAMDAVGLTIDYAFDWYDFHMIRLEAAEFNAAQWQGNGILHEILDDEHLTQDIFKIGGKSVGLYEATIRRAKWNRSTLRHGAIAESNERFINE